jgi:hypothetical protein
VPEEEHASESSALTSVRALEPSRRRQRFVRFALLALDALAVGLLLIVVFSTRLLTLESIEVGGDAITVWEFARDLLQGAGFPDKFNHHTLRFGLVIPTLLTQWILGPGATTYFVGPLIASTLVHLLTYLIGRKLSGPLAGLLATVGLLLFEPMVRASSQILPETYGPLFVLAAIYSALEFTDAAHKWSRYLSLGIAAVSGVFAYGAKESYLYFLPTIALLIWRANSSRDPQPTEPLARGDEGLAKYAVRFLWSKFRGWGLVTPAVLGAALLGITVVEWIFLATVTETQNAGRLSVIVGSHSAQGAIDAYQVRDVADFFSLYTGAPDDWMIALIVGAVALLGVGAFAQDRRARHLALGFFIYFLLQTFVLRSFSPPIPWMEPHPRYLLAMAAPIALLVGIFTHDALRSVLSKGAQPTLTLGAPARLGSLCIAILLFSRLGADVLEKWEKEWGKQDAWHRTGLQGVQFTEAFNSGIPIVSDTPRGKPARAALSVFIDPASLFIDGKFSPRRFSRRLDGGAYVARAVGLSDVSRKRLDNAVRTRADGGQCAVVLRQRTRGMTASSKIAKTCVSLEEEFEQNPQAGRTHHKLPTNGSKTKRQGR